MRTFVFIDGQNFYLSSRRAFRAHYPNFDARKVADLLSQKATERDADHIGFYTGMPVRRYSPQWAAFWTNKIAAMQEDGIDTYTRNLQYTYEDDAESPTGFKILTTREKGIDMRIALDVMAAARRDDCGAIIIVSRDQDFTEVVKDVKIMADFSGRDIEVWSAYPDGGNGPSHLRGIAGTKQMTVNPEEYAGCLDPVDYRKPRVKTVEQNSAPALS